MIKNFNMTDGGKRIYKIGTILSIFGLTFMGFGAFDMGRAEVLREIEKSIDKGGFAFTTNGKTKKALIVSDKEEQR